MRTNNIIRDLLRNHLAINLIFVTLFTLTFSSCEKNEEIDSMYEESYKLSVNNPEGFIIENETARIKTESDGTLKSNPGELFVAFTNTNGSIITKNNVDVLQYTRDLILDINCDYDTYNNIRSIKAQIKGLAQSINLRSGEIVEFSDNLITVVEFEKRFSFVKEPGTTVAKSKYEISAEFCLLKAGVSNGFTPHQMLLTVIYEMNNGDTIIRECDITNEMRHFNEDINPFYLDCSALNAPQEIQITPVVNDWN